MSNEQNQNLKNHAKMDPAYHYIGSAILLFCFALALFQLFNALRFHPDLTLLAVWAVAFSVLLFIVYFKMRLYPLKVQDRVIRLEERLRLAMLLDDKLRHRIPELTEDQLIALRFASDDEVPKLVAEALDKKLTRKEIKERIETWRPDNWRV